MTPVAWFRPVRHLVRKEFRQLRRDRAMLRMVFIMPIVQIFILSYAATTDLRNVRLSVLDEDRTPQSRELIESFFNNTVFVPGPASPTSNELEEHLFRGRADMTLRIPLGHAADLAAGETAVISVAVDGANSNAAGRALGYAQTAVQHQERRLLEEKQRAQPAFKIHRIEAATRFFYNPELESRNYIVPGIIVILITMITGMLSGMAVVREKEIGTLEQLLVTPLTAGQLIAGKLIPFAILAYLELAVTIPMAVLWFKLPFAGSVMLLFACALVYLLVTLGGGLLASTVSHTQQQSMFTVWFFAIFGILTSGYFYPVENMPEWIYLLTYANPMRYFMVIVRGIFLKGASLMDLLPQLLPLLAMGMATFSFAVLRFRKRVA